MKVPDALLLCKSFMSIIFMFYVDYLFKSADSFALVRGQPAPGGAGSIPGHVAAF